MLQFYIVPKYFIAINYSILAGVSLCTSWSPSFSPWNWRRWRMITGLFYSHLWSSGRWSETEILPRTNSVSEILTNKTASLYDGKTIQMNGIYSNKLFIQVMTILCCYDGLLVPLSEKVLNWTPSKFEIMSNFQKLLSNQQLYAIVQLGTFRQ